LPDIAGGVGLCSPITGGRPPGNCYVGGANGANLTTTATDASPTWTYGDSVSWTKGKHTVKIGGEFRFNRHFYARQRAWWRFLPEQQNPGCCGCRCRSKCAAPGVGTNSDREHESRDDRTRLA